MPEISGNTLMMAIPTIDEPINELAQQLNRDEDDGSGETERLLLSHEKSLIELRDAYEHARQTTSNLPPYAQLISGE